MPCPHCEGECRCDVAALSAELIETENFDPSFEASVDPTLDQSEDQFEASLNPATPPEIALKLENSSTTAELLGNGSVATMETYAEATEWKEEVSRRVEGYRTRRGRGRADRASRSIGFTFEPETLPPAPEPLLERSFIQPSPPAFVEAQLETPSIPVQVSALSTPPEISAAAPPQLDGTTLGRLIETVRYVESRTAENKVIEFPHPEEPLVDLAEPLIMPPRIFEAEDVAEVEREHEKLARTVAPPVPTIMLETPLTPEPRVAAQFDLPLPVAPLRWRTWAAVFDLAVVACATLLFGLGCIITSGFPEGREAVATMIGAAAASWCVYQYLGWSRLGATLGMRYIGLRLMRFEKPITRKLLRARAAAVVLSSAALGLGFFWALLDSDRLTWHDRITQTFLSER
jgi:uncharacterized RDD family membrane protein YckC